MRCNAITQRVKEVSGNVSVSGKQYFLSLLIQKWTTQAGCFALANQDTGS